MRLLYAALPLLLIPVTVGCSKEPAFDLVFKGRTVEKAGGVTAASNLADLENLLANHTARILKVEFGCNVPYSVWMSLNRAIYTNEKIKALFVWLRGAKGRLLLKREELVPHLISEPSPDPKSIQYEQLIMCVESDKEGLLEHLTSFSDHAEKLLKQPEKEGAGMQSCTMSFHPILHECYTIPPFWSDGVRMGTFDASIAGLMKWTESLRETTGPIPLVLDPDAQVPFGYVWALLMTCEKAGIPTDEAFRTTRWRWAVEEKVK
jgi:hypothetical protein